MDNRDLKQAKRFILKNEKIKEITRKNILIYLLKGMLERVKLLNTDFDNKEMREALLSWYNNLKKEMELIK